MATRSTSPRRRSPLTAEEFAALARRELERADRSLAQLSLIRLDLPLSARGSPGFDAALRAILGRVRSIDEVGWLAGGLGILLPETGSSGAWKLVRDLREGDPSGLLRSSGIEVHDYTGSEAAGPRAPTHAVGRA